MSQLGAEVLGVYSLIAVIVLAIYHAIRYTREDSIENQLTIVVLVPVIIFLTNVI
ncbi:MAG: hypothetical protein LKE46_00075 [Clostridium sp.]|jgi:hypothetical protein|uniref:hypothetical protein n=1 Tax=Clostridium sp. TaxID=1506 RepID=UPI0025C6FCE6|nr:hypothetical protein [Clostridium sp.]MCH3962663.1 hypothetical protein [Clostridium sp.]MCI2201048.1 hypothetical protein [Clostridium sp.]